MAGTRPLGLTLSKGSCWIVLVWRIEVAALLWADVAERTFLQVGKVHNLRFVRDVQLIHDDGNLPRVRALCVTCQPVVFSRALLVAHTPAWL